MAELDLTLWDNFLPEDLTLDIMRIAINDLNVPPSYPITLKHYEALWGDSEVAQLNNNWGGVTWGTSWDDPHTRPSGVIVTRGTSRPAIEGGHYVNFESVADYFIDWAYLMSADGAGIYNVQDSETFRECVHGMFRVGGAMYDYATMNVESSQERYDLYYAQMLARRNAINDANNAILDRIDNGDFDHLIEDDENGNGNGNGNGGGEPDPPDPEPPEIDIDDVVEQISQALHVDLYDYGNKHTFGNDYLTLITQLENTYKIRPTSKFNAFLIEILDGAIVPPEPEPEPEPDPDPDPEPEPDDEPVFPTREGLPITSGYGYRDIGGGASNWHWAIDIGHGGYSENPIVATQSGVVIENFWTDGGGWRITLQHTGDEYYSQYKHMRYQSDLSEGTTVEKGERIGTMGTTGTSTGDHLDFAVSTDNTWGINTPDPRGTVDPVIYLGL